MIVGSKNFRKVFERNEGRALDAKVHGSIPSVVYFFLSLSGLEDVIGINCELLDHK